MALKLKITKTAFDKLSDEMKELYTLEGNEATLDVDGIEDPAELKRAKDREVVERKKLAKELKEANDRLADLEGDDARKSGDIQKIEDSWKKKLSDAEGKGAELLAKAQGFIRTTLVDNVARTIASKISKSPNVLLPHIKARLEADLEGDEPVTKVKDAAGKVSNMTIEALEQEFVANKDFADIIIASRANGGGGAPRQPLNNGSAATSTSQNEKPPLLAKLPAKDLASHLKSLKEAAAT